VALAVLLSLSSIAAIGGLVAISMQTVAPATGSTAVAPVESNGPIATIHVGEAAQGPEEPRAKRAEPAASETTASTPSPVGASGGDSGGSGNIGAGTGANGGKGGKEGGNGHGGGRSGTYGAWCDARQGSSCDAVAGGVLQPSEASDVELGGIAYEGDGYMATDDDLDDHGDDADHADWDDDASDHSGSGESHGHGKH
jgi:hypothetical protein